MSEDSTVQWPHHDPGATVDDYAHHYAEYPEHMPEALRPRFEQVLADAATGASTEIVSEASRDDEGIPSRQSALSSLSELLKRDDVDNEQFSNAFQHLHEDDTEIDPQTAGAVLRAIRVSQVKYGENPELNAALSQDPGLVGSMVTFAKSNEATDWDKVTMMSVADDVHAINRLSMPSDKRAPDELLIDNVYETLQPEVGAFDMGHTDASPGRFIRRYGSAEKCGVSVSQAEVYDKLHPTAYDSDPKPLIAPEVVRDFCKDYEAAHPAIQKLAQEYPDRADDALELNKYIPNLKEDGIVDDEEMVRETRAIGEMLMIHSGPKSTARYRASFQLSKETLDECLEAGVKITDFVQFMNSSILFMTPKLGKKMREQDTTALQEAADHVVRVAINIMKRPDIFNPTGHEATIVMDKVLSSPNSGLVSRATTNAEALLENYDSLVEAGYPKHLLHENLLKFIGSSTISGEDSNMPNWMRAMQMAAPKLQHMEALLGPLVQDSVTLEISRGLNANDASELKKGLVSIDEFCASLEKLRDNNPAAFETVRAILTDPNFVGKEGDSIGHHLYLGNFTQYQKLAAQLANMTDTESTVNELCSLLYSDEALLTANEYIDASLIPHILDRKLAEEEFDFLVHIYDGPNAFQQPGLGQRIADKLFANCDIFYLAKLPEEEYLPTPDQVQLIETELFDHWLAHGKFENGFYAQCLKEASKLTPSGRPFITGKVLELFGSYGSGDAAVLLYEILNGEPGDNNEAIQLGITDKGAAGIIQLERVIHTFTAELNTLDFSEQSLELLEKSPLLQTVLKKLTRYEGSKWGEHGDDELQRLITYTNQLRRDGEFTEMASEYQPSDVIEIHKLVVDKERATWPDDFLARYKKLRRELIYSAKTLDSMETLGYRPFHLLRNGVINGIEHLIEDFDSKLEHPSLPDKAREGMERRRDELKALITPSDQARPESTPLQSAKSFQTNFMTLAQHPELHETLRPIFFALAIRQNPQYKEIFREAEWGELEQPTLDQVAEVREFVEHIVNQETFKEYFQDKKAAKQFKRITNVSDFDDAMQRYQKTQGIGKTTKLQFIPTRGLGLELSGHIADACWASKYPSIAQKMPNMTAVIMKQNPEDPNREKLVGSFLLIETGAMGRPYEKPVLVIRGLNPLEGYINHVSLDDFFDSVTNYASEIAKARKMDLAIVIDNHSGGSSTNRPVLYNYLNGMRRSLEHVVVRNNDTHFNGYNITNDTYRLPLA